MQPRDFLELARELLKDTSPDHREQRHRVVTSRVYYAVYHRGCMFADAMGAPLMLDVKSVHERLRRRLDALLPTTKQPDTDLLKKIIHGVTQLGRWRVEADYHIEREFNPTLAAQSIEWSDRMFRHMDAMTRELGQRQPGAA